MGKGFASLGDKLADKKVPCRVRGCPRTWVWRAAEQVKAFSAGQTTPPQRMCDLCHARAQTLEDQQVGCQTAGCEGTFQWARMAQLEAIFRHPGADSPPPPRGLCEACRARVKEIGDKPVPCRVKGCQRTWTWTGRAQVAAGASPGGEEVAPPSRMCDECHEVYERLRDERRPCKVRGCARSWFLSRWTQLEALAAGRTEMPERMCDECAHTLKGLVDEELPCRTDGCHGKWVWTRGQKLEASVHGGPGVPPQRMCPQCQSRFAQLKDVTVPCKRTGCRGAWVYKRGAQLERWVKHGEGPDTSPPHRLCETCRKHLDDFHDREVTCKNDGCNNTWTWTRFAQLQAAETGHGSTPPAHMCQECRDFLEHHRTKTIHCGKCDAEFHWAPELQLRTKLGLMREPALCGSCKREEATQAPRRKLETVA